MLLLDDLDFNLFAVNRQGYENDFSSCPRYTRTPERDVFNAKFGATRGAKMPSDLVLSNIRYPSKCYWPRLQ